MSVLQRNLFSGLLKDAVEFYTASARVSSKPINWDDFIAKNKVTLGHHENEIKTIYAVRDNLTIQIDVPISDYDERENTGWFKWYSQIGLKGEPEETFYKKAACIGELAGVRGIEIQPVIQSLLKYLLKNKGDLTDG